MLFETIDYFYLLLYYYYPHIVIIYINIVLHKIIDFLSYICELSLNLKIIQTEIYTIYIFFLLN